MFHKTAAQLSTIQAKAIEATTSEDGSVSLEQALIAGGLCIVGAALVGFLTGHLGDFTSRIKPE